MKYVRDRIRVLRLASIKGLLILLPAIPLILLLLLQITERAGLGREGEFVPGRVADIHGNSSIVAGIHVRTDVHTHRRTEK